jgi:hypothetical protein
MCLAGPVPCRNPLEHDQEKIHMFRKPTAIGRLAKGATFIGSIDGVGNRRWWRRMKIVATTPLSSLFVRVRAVIIKTGEVVEWTVSAKRKFFDLNITFA